MNIKDLHIHVHTSDGREILHEIHNLKNLIMATKQEFQAALAEMSTGLDNIAADIKRLTDTLQTGNLTEAEENEVFTQLRAVADRINVIAATTPEPETPPTT